MHAALDPEYSILKQRIARRLRHEGATDESVKALNLSELFQGGVEHGEEFVCALAVRQRAASTASELPFTQPDASHTCNPNRAFTASNPDPTSRSRHHQGG